MSDTRQFLRRAQLVVGTTEIVDLRFTFRITKTLKPQPNQAEIKVRNLSPATRKLLEEPKTLPCELKVGYVDAPLHTVFLGTVRTALSHVERTEVITTIATGDDKHVGSRAHVKIPARATPKQLLELVAGELGVGAGNVVEALKSAIGGGPVAARAFTGRGPDVFTQLCRSAGLEWSVQDGVLQVLPLGKPTTGEVVRLSSDTGLLGSPTVDNKGVLSARCYIQPDIVPGRLVVIESRLLNGGYRIEEVVLDGDTHEGPWYCDFHARKY